MFLGFRSRWARQAASSCPTWVIQTQNLMGQHTHKNGKADIQTPVSQAVQHSGCQNATFNTYAGSTPLQISKRLCCGRNSSDRHAMELCQHSLRDPRERLLLPAEQSQPLV